ncbi:Hint domain-containing protein [Paracoccus laeviglucosivorans]|uniref:Ca2+-binding protein, RTX toxin-related n=1 Tax=Paracoccus laeviglucosivorans TaxID=1197861 RepID=A0A521DAQ1_9RHOB|nr:Hint domain-containing protein [Paracoccus laeviglucosivorans]SMO68796.1 Ca2+-binding protein, RTX toxin-related [Paracoccus laeviglucosivorans]
MADFPGTNGADSLIGTADADSMSGGDGNDTILGMGGNDTVDGGEGADRLYWKGSPTGGDNAVFHGGNGHEPVWENGIVTHLTGSEGYTFDVYNHNGGDTLALNYGSDVGVTLTYSTAENGTAVDANGNTVQFDGIERVWLGNGNNLVDARDAQDLFRDGPDHYVGMRLYSGNGSDTIYGSGGTDYIQSGGGNDTVYGGAGNDVIETGGGDDVAYGGADNDGFRWGDGGSNAAIGNDFYDGGTGFNTLNAWQSAPPTVEGESGAGIHVVLDTDSSGDIDALGGVQGHLRFENFQNLRTGGGNDVIDGSNANVDGYRVFADWGNDSIIGSRGDDTLEGGWGGDTIIGGLGNDFISMNGDIFAQVSRPDASTDTLVLADGFGQDTIRSFAFGGEADSDGNPAPADVLDVSGLHDADGNPIRVGDVTVRADVDQYNNQFAVIHFPNGEELWFQGVDPDTLTRERLLAMGIPCFCRGTTILTDRGEIAVQDLRVGDMVQTRDNGLQPVRWIGSRALDRVDLALAPRLQPIRIRAGALGAGLPAADLLVSPQHRVLVRSAIAQRMFGADEVLVAAKQLTAMDGIEALSVDQVEYFHILFDRHEIIVSNGAETESLYTGPEAMKALGQSACDEIFTLFPELRDMPATGARPFVSGGKARNMAERHQRNHKQLFCK